MVILAILICLIWFSKAVTFIEFITEKGIKLSDFLFLFVLILPWLALLIIPISLFIGILVSYGRMKVNNELTILENSGIDKFHLLKPVARIGFYCTIFCYIISLYLMPLANKKLRLARTDFQHNYENLIISPGIFETLNKMTIYVKDRNSQNELFEVLLYDNRNPEYAITITSRYGKIDNRAEVLLHLTDGTVQKYNYETKKSEILKFDQYVVNLNERETEKIEFKWKATERYIWELINPTDDPKGEFRAEYYYELHKRFVYPLFSLVLSIIAVAFILKGQFSRRVNIINEIQATAAGVAFIVSIMTLYDMVEKNSALAPLLYVDALIFVVIGLNLLRTKKLK